ncbi:MAG TPA: N-acetylmuramic acid 6-phosphate etherase [Blastocatellia bacterium]|nr:N-acetylmuramic acid 6-phosphate etherase [Blastocatellia bacterium]
MTITEQINPNTIGIDELPTLDALRIINDEDKKVAEAVEKVLPAIARAVDAIVERFKRGGRLFYIGAGTSGRLGVLDASECAPTFGVSPDMVQGIIAGGYEACYKAVEASEDDREAGARDLQDRVLTVDDAVVGVAASGRTPYAIGAVQYARKIGALTLCVTCNENTELARAVEIPIEPVPGPEVIAGSTRLKSGTAQKMVLNMLSTMTMTRLGYVTGNLMTNVTTRNAKLRQRALGIFMADCGLDEATAKSILDKADWDLPVAMVMVKANTTRELAEDALKKSGHIIARAVAYLLA